MASSIINDGELDALDIKISKTQLSKLAPGPTSEADKTSYLKKYIKVEELSDGWCCYFKIGNQSFVIAERATKRRAQWFGVMLRLALDKLIKNEK